MTYSLIIRGSTSLWTRMGDSTFFPREGSEDADLKDIPLGGGIESSCFHYQKALMLKAWSSHNALSKRTWYSH